ncbi:CDC28 [Symbiodinium natans]|uniref:Cyclin-dependent kinase 2 homolog n=1 Tax=Symbiodinium natans TaxID=878477 RepID=A0A812Q1D8_9DINO|nr:CDC28 [Symbiodinium natans]
MHVLEPTDSAPALQPKVLVKLRWPQAPRLVLADFGLARALHVPLKVYTHEVVTLWYRPPEILLGQEQYGTAADIWSMGCVLAEMATAQALFPGDSEIHTIFKIFHILGTPTEEVWPGVTSLVDFKESFPRWRGTGFAEVRARAPSFGEDGIDLLRQCLRYEPSMRTSARRALSHTYLVPTSRLGG